MRINKLFIIGLSVTTTVFLVTILCIGVASENKRLEEFIFFHHRDILWFGGVAGLVLYIIAMLNWIKNKILYLEKSQSFTIHLLFAVLACVLFPIVGPIVGVIHILLLIHFYLRDCKNNRKQENIY